MKYLWAFVVLCIVPPNIGAAIPAAHRNNDILRVGVAGSEPFVVKTTRSLEGISVEIWQALAAQAGWRYKLLPYKDVPLALHALSSGDLDLIVGPVSITAERTRYALFSQPYFESSLSILAPMAQPSIWQRVAPLFNSAFYYAAGTLLLVLTLVGTLIWLSERRVAETQFPREPGRGIASGIWFAVVTMSTVGYGDFAPKTRLGQAITGIWIIVSVIAASSLVAGIASTLTLSALRNSVISNAEQLTGKTVAALEDSPGEKFAQRYGARVHRIETLQEGYDLLQRKNVDAIVFDRPQLRYFLQKQHDSSLAVSSAEYMRQNYGFAMPLSTSLLHAVNVNLLQLEESGRVDRIVRAWLGENSD